MQNSLMAPGATLLVVSVGPEHVALFKSAFHDWYPLHCKAANGVSLAQRIQPTAIIVDASEDESSGFEICRQLGDEPSTCEIPILYIGAQTGATCELKAFTAGASDYMADPIDPQVLRARVERQIQTKSRLDQLHYMAMHDPLTCLANRRVLFERLSLEWRRALRCQRPIALLMVDIDCFKPYNDYYGHLEGDECLVSIGRVIERAVSRAGDLVARYGGEEFAVVLPDTNREHAMAIAERIRGRVQALKIPHAASTSCAEVTVSIGVSSAQISHHPGSNTDVNRLTKHLLEAADNALYECKRTGRNRIAYVPMRLDEGAKELGAARGSVRTAAPAFGSSGETPLTKPNSVQDFAERAGIG